MIPGLCSHQEEEIILLLTAHSILLFIYKRNKARNLNKLITITVCIVGIWRLVITSLYPYSFSVSSFFIHLKTHVYNPFKESRSQPEVADIIIEFALEWSM